MATFSQSARGRNDGINHMQGIYLNVYSSNSFVRPRISRWQSHLNLDEIPITDEEAVALYTPQVLLDKDRIAVAQTIIVKKISRWTEYIGDASSVMLWLKSRKLMAVRTSWQSILKVVDGEHSLNDRVTSYKTALLCRGEFYWFFERLGGFERQEWEFCPLSSLMHENGVEHLKRIVTLEEMAL